MPGRRGGLSSQRDVLRKLCKNSAAHQTKCMSALETIEANTASQGRAEQGLGTAAATTKTVCASIDKFQSGDAVKFASGVFDVIGSASAFLSLTGPQGAVAAACIAPLCQIISCILCQTNPPESQEDMMKRVIDSALTRLTLDELNSSVQGLLQGMNGRMTTVDSLIKSTDPLSKESIQMIASDNYMNDGLEFLGKLLYYIKKRMASDKKDDAEDTICLIRCYLQISYLRQVQLFKIAVLFSSNGKRDLSQLALDNMNNQKARDRKDFEFWLSGVYYPYWLKYEMSFRSHYGKKMLEDKVATGYANICIGQLGQISDQDTLRYQIGSAVGSVCAEVTRGVGDIISDVLRDAFQDLFETIFFCIAVVALLNLQAFFVLTKIVLKKIYAEEGGWLSDFIGYLSSGVGILLVLLILHKMVTHQEYFAETKDVAVALLVLVLLEVVEIYQHSALIEYPFVGSVVLLWIWTITSVLTKDKKKD
eukprot:CAMPEP_0171299954 /NCGR_PEP_ID=MMETSP0816-20121228/8820_1 /TAXON_ID=420281 /ORGANISM="Proboscia inermis, Strain CCAP1064/1" /LENGTH=477 /DNA_ID=CAMNT_0011776175 /DNA_START=38 /DNA_END=1471 /DNA_ORIENTATION=-